MNEQCIAKRVEWVMGLDLGDRKSYYVVVDRDEGEAVAEGWVKTEARALRELFGRWEKLRVVMETGTHSPWVSRVAKGAECETIVANARQMELIAKSTRKGDKADARLLARVGRTDVELLAPVQHRSREAQEKLVWARSRQALVEARTKLINSVRGQVKAWGGRLPRCGGEVFARRAVDALPKELAEALVPVLGVIQHVSDQIRDYDRRLEREAGQDPVIGHLRQIDGVGALVASSYVWTLEQPERFAQSRDVGAYLGLVPRRRQSGDSDPQLGVTKTGDPRLRRLLVQSAHYILGPFGKDCDLRRFGLKLAEKRGKRKAVVAVARRLAVLMHRLWVTGEVYDPFYQEKRRAAA